MQGPTGSGTSLWGLRTKPVPLVLLALLPSPSLPCLHFPLSYLPIHQHTELFQVEERTSQLETYSVSGASHPYYRLNTVPGGQEAQSTWCSVAC